MAENPPENGDVVEEPQEQAPEAPAAEAPETPAPDRVPAGDGKPPLS